MIAAMHEDLIVGNVVIIMKQNNDGTKYGWVDDLFVSKDWRKKGIGESLMNRAFIRLKELNVRESKLEVWSSNKRAMSVYSKIGYKFLIETEVSIGMLL